MTEIKPSKDIEHVRPTKVERERRGQGSTTKAKPGKNIEHVDAKVTVIVPPLRVVPAPEPQREIFTREYFEDALDKASRPLKGKYADVLPSSEDFIKQKREEVELEDGLS